MLNRFIEQNTYEIGVDLASREEPSVVACMSVSRHK